MSDHDEKLQIVNRYLSRLDPDIDPRKIQRALQKLNEVEMTLQILQDTGVGKIVNNLRKHEEVGKFAKQLVTSWKSLLSEKPKSNSKKIKYEVETESTNNDEYDPTENWEMKNQEQKKKRKSYSPESDKSDAYDPTQNWKMEEKSEEVEAYSPEPAYDDGYVPSNNSHRDDSDEDINNGHNAPSVQSTTLYTKGDGRKSKNNAQLEDNRRTQRLDDRPRVKNHKSNSQQIDKKKKNRPDKQESRPTVDQQQEVSKKRKSDSDIPSKPKKSKTKKEKSSSSNMSFEDFMTMDTSKKAKKKKKIPNVASTSGLLNGTSPSKPKVELHLPQVQPTYRPLPSHNATPDPQGPTLDQMTDQMAAALHTQRSKAKMQIYSGQKTSILPKMMSLYSQCMRVLLNNIDKLDAIGVPYDIIKPVLEKCTAEQLYRLEDVNQYLLDDTDELWQKLTNQDFRGKRPDEMESWRELYLRLHDAREEKLARLTQSIQAKVVKSKPLAKRTKLAYVGIGEAKAPRNVLRAQMKYGTAGKKYNDTPSASAAPTASSLRQRTTEMRLSVPVGSITAASVDGHSSSRTPSKKAPPRIAPMMAKTLKSINKLRMKR